MDDSGNQPAERGSRRRRIAAMAGTVYRAGVAAASEIRDQYNTTSRALMESDGSGDGYEDRPPSIPGAFPGVPFAISGDAQMVLFPMYAKNHIRKYKDSDPAKAASSEDGAAATPSSPVPVPGDENYWHYQFMRLEDAKAVVDVNVHGWIYLPQKGALNRKNRLLIGLARRLSGIPAPYTAAAATATGIPAGQLQPPVSAIDIKEQQRIAREAEAIEKLGQGEKEMATRGQYSEVPQTTAAEDSDEEATSQNAGRSGLAGSKRAHSPAVGGGNSPRDMSRSSSPAPGNLTPRPSWGPTPNATAAPEMSEAELIEANKNLLARLSPFLTSPVVDQPVTLFFYNDTESQSRTVTTSDAGHFSICAALEFVPTHVRVLVSNTPSETYNPHPSSDPLSAVTPIHLVDDRGVTLISDIDDTVKASNIAGGAREIFRSTFVKDLAEMAVEGTREWYGSLQNLGVQFHYCSNSPWQLFPMLSTFFSVTGLPRGPLHLKQYSGMLQGIFEPVAERKRGTLEKILRDFPHRRFLLVGDSGEADLEVYTDLVLAHPGRVLAIFIRDVTTPEQPGYFDAATTTSSLDRRPPAPPPRTASAPLPGTVARTDGPVMGKLIDLDADSDEPRKTSPIPGTASSSPPSLSPSRKPLPPPRPTKPMSLRGSMMSHPPGPAAASTETASTTPAAPSISRTSSTSSRGSPPPPPAPRRRPAATSVSSTTGPSHPLAQVTNTSSASMASREEPAPLLPPRRTGTNSSLDPGSQQQQTSAAPPNKKVDMWRRRLAHAQDMLAPQGVALYTWRRGQDVAVEAVGIVKAALAKG